MIWKEGIVYELSSRVFITGRPAARRSSATPENGDAAHARITNLKGGSTMSSVSMESKRFEYRFEFSPLERNPSSRLLRFGFVPCDFMDFWDFWLRDNVALFSLVILVENLLAIEPSRRTSIPSSNALMADRSWGSAVIQADKTAIAAPLEKPYTPSKGPRV